jgi:hypothetical protein
MQDKDGAIVHSESSSIPLTLLVEHDSSVKQRRRGPTLNKNNEARAWVQKDCAFGLPGHYGEAFVAERNAGTGWGVLGPKHRKRQAAQTARTVFSIFGTTTETVHGPISEMSLNHEESLWMIFCSPR